MQEKEKPEQIAIITTRGDGVAVTGFKMIRFWISQEESIQFIIKALTESKGGETFIAKISSFQYKCGRFKSEETITRLMLSTKLERGSYHA